MPENLLQTGGAGGAGALFGSILTFLGFRKRIEHLEDKVMYKDTCKATVKGVQDTLYAQTELMKEMRSDIKSILKNG